MPKISELKIGFFAFILKNQPGSQTDYLSWVKMQCFVNQTVLQPLHNVTKQDEKIIECAWYPVLGATNYKQSEYCNQITFVCSSIT